MALKLTPLVLVVVCILHLFSRALLSRTCIALMARFSRIGVLSLRGSLSRVARVVVPLPGTSSALGRVAQLSGMSLLVSFPIPTRRGWLLTVGSGMVVQVVKLQLSRAAVVANCLESESDFSIMVTRLSLLWAVSVSTYMFVLSAALAPRLATLPQCPSSPPAPISRAVFLCRALA